MILTFSQDTDQWSKVCKQGKICLTFVVCRVPCIWGKTGLRLVTRGVIICEIWWRCRSKFMSIMHFKCTSFPMFWDALVFHWKIQLRIGLHWRERVVDPNTDQSWMKERPIQLWSARLRDDTGDISRSASLYRLAEWSSFALDNVLERDSVNVNFLNLLFQPF